MFDKVLNITLDVIHALFTLIDGCQSCSMLFITRGITQLLLLHHFILVFAEILWKSRFTIQKVDCIGIYRTLSSFYGWTFRSELRQKPLHRWLIGSSIHLCIHRPATLLKETPTQMFSFEIYSSRSDRKYTTDFVCIWFLFCFYVKILKRHIL